MARPSLALKITAGLPAAALFALDCLLPPDLSRLKAVGRVVADREGYTLSALPAPGGIWRLPVGPDDVPRPMAPCPASPHTVASAHAGGGREGAAVRTTLDALTHRGLEALARDALRDLPDRAAVALVTADLRSRRIRTLVGGD